LPGTGAELENVVLQEESYGSVLNCIFNARLNKVGDLADLSQSPTEPFHVPRVQSITCAVKLGTSNIYETDIYELAFKHAAGFYHIKKGGKCSREPGGHYT